MKKEKQVEIGDKYVADGKYEKALKTYRKLIDAFPDDMRLQIKLGDLFVKKREVSKALETYRAVADTYVRERFHLKAIAVYKMILKLNPTMVIVNEKLGDLYRDVGLQKDAISQYFIVADHYEQTNRMKELLEVRRKIVETDPSAVTSRIRLAEIYQKEGSSEDSLREYERAAQDLRERNDKDTLIEVYERILYHRPEETDLFCSLCGLYMEKNDIHKAQQRLEALTPEVAKSPDVMELAIDVYLKLEQREKVRRLMKDVYEFYAEKGDAERAAAIFAKAREEFEDDDEYLIVLDEIRQKAGIRELPATEPVSAEEPSGIHQKISDEDLEKTTMVRLDEMPPPPSEPAPPKRQEPQASESEIDLDKTVMVRLDEEKPQKKSATPSKKTKKEEPANLDETVMVSAAELEKQFKNKKKD